MAKRSKKSAKKVNGKKLTRRSGRVERKHKPPSATYVEIYAQNVKKGAKKSWGFRAKAGNHEIIGQGEGYTRRATARRGSERAFPGAEVKYL